MSSPPRTGPTSVLRSGSSITPIRVSTINPIRRGACVQPGLWSETHRALRRTTLLRYFPDLHFGQWSGRWTTLWLFVDFCTSRVPDGSSATSQETCSVQSVLERERRLATPHDDGDEHLREVLGELQDAATDLSEVILLGVGRGAQRRSPTPAMQPEVPLLEPPVFSIWKDLGAARNDALQVLQE